MSSLKDWVDKVYIRRLHLIKHRNRGTDVSRRALAALITAVFYKGGLHWVCRDRYASPRIRNGRGFNSGSLDVIEVGSESAISSLNLSILTSPSSTRDLLPVVFFGWTLNACHKTNTANCRGSQQCAASFSFSFTKWHGVCDCFGQSGRSVRVGDCEVWREACRNNGQPKLGLFSSPIFPVADYELVVDIFAILSEFDLKLAKL